jgi:hypothetical protein
MENNTLIALLEQFGLFLYNLVVSTITPKIDVAKARADAAFAKAEQEGIRLNGEILQVIETADTDRQAVLDNNIVVMGKIEENRDLIERKVSTYVYVDAESANGVSVLDILTADGQSDFTNIVYAIKNLDELNIAIPNLDPKEGPFELAKGQSLIVSFDAAGDIVKVLKDIPNTSLLIQNYANYAEQHFATLGLLLNATQDANSRIAIAKTDLLRTVANDYVDKGSLNTRLEQMQTDWTAIFAQAQINVAATVANQN